MEKSALNRSPRPAAFWPRLRQALKRNRRILHFAHALHAVWWLGPWRGLMIRYHQWRCQNTLLQRGAETIFPDLDTGVALSKLKTQGYALGVQVPEVQVNQVLDFCERRKADAYSNPHINCQAVNTIAHDPKILEVVSGYFGSEPMLYSSSLYWTWPPADEKKRQRALSQKARFHYDVGDFKTLLLFVYLTDVDEEGGPHVVIEGSHHGKTPRRLLSRYINDQEALAEFGDRIKIITGPRGTGFFEDVTCYHKHAVGIKPRLMLTICYLLRRAPR